MPGTSEVAKDLPSRLRAAAAAVSDAKKAWELRITQRDELAKLAGVAPGRVHAILTNSQRDEGDEG
jgi:hypothetical protein